MLIICTGFLMVLAGVSVFLVFYGLTSKPRYLLLIRLVLLIIVLFGPY